MNILKLVSHALMDLTLAIHFLSIKYVKVLLKTYYINVNLIP